MVTYFNKKDMVSFGCYLLSEKRRVKFVESYEEDLKIGLKNPLSVEERIKEVHHADIENWISENNKHV